MSILDDNELVALTIRLSPDTPLNTESMNKFSKDKQFVNSSTITARFGSISNFQAACGFEVRLQPKEMTNEQLIELAREIRPDRLLTQREIDKLSKEGTFVSAATLGKRFGSLSNFHRACGF